MIDSFCSVLLMHRYCTGTCTVLVQYRYAVQVPGTSTSSYYATRESPRGRFESKDDDLASGVWRASLWASVRRCRKMKENAEKSWSDTVPVHRARVQKQRFSFICLSFDRQTKILGLLANHRARERSMPSALL